MTMPSTVYDVEGIFLLWSRCVWAAQVLDRRRDQKVRNSDVELESFTHDIDDLTRF
jgi:hypothetical protein